MYRRYSRRLSPAALSCRAPFQSLLLYHRLTTPGFRQRADRERTFTASAPPGMRPPPRRSEPDEATDSFVDRDLDRDLGREAEAEMEMSRGQPRRDAVFTPCPRRHSTA